MPFIAQLVAAYLIGLLAGFSASLPWVVGIGVGLAAAAWRHDRHPQVAVVGIVAVCGGIAAHAAKVDRLRCTGRIADPIVAVLGGDASPGAFVPAVVLCGSPISISVAEGSAAAGSTVQVTGAVVRSASGIVVQRATVRSKSRAPLMARIRASMGERIDRLFKDDAPLVRALVVADKTELSPELRTRFASAGLVHILAISGLHIGIVAAIAELVLFACRLPARGRPLAAFTIVSLYIMAIGAPAASVRAGMMLAVRAVSRWLQRPTSPMTILALASLAPAADPWVVLNAGFQLSVAGVTAFIAAARVPSRLGLATTPKWRSALISAVICSTIATIATAPLVAWTFGRVSVLGPVTGLVAVPIVTVLQPILFLALVVSTGPVAAFIAGAAHPLLMGLQAIASLGASIPWGVLTLAPTPVAAVIGGVASVALLRACASRHVGQPLVVAGACAAFLALPPIPTRSGLTELHVIDVGQGDAIALRTRAGHWVVFDAGPAGFGLDAGKAIVVPYLEARGGSVAAFVLSHPHTDHVGGASAVIHALHPPLYYDPGYAAPTDYYRRSLQAAVDEHERWIRVRPGDSLVVDEVTIQLLAPDSTWAVSLRDPNNASTIALVRVGDVRFLLVGDAERSEEEWLLQHDSADLHADVLKVGHHGSNTSSTPAFLNAVHPALALVSVGAGNKYGHPSPETMRSIVAHGAQVLRTDLVGTIVVRTDGHTVSVDAAGDQWTLRPMAK